MRGPLVSISSDMASDIVIPKSPMAHIYKFTTQISEYFRAKRRKYCA
jgi:hypothetical protein